MILRRRPGGALRGGLVPGSCGAGAGGSRSRRTAGQLGETDRADNGPDRSAEQNRPGRTEVEALDDGADHRAGGTTDRPQGMEGRHDRSRIVPLDDDGLIIHGHIGGAVADPEQKDGNTEGGDVRRVDGQVDRDDTEDEPADQHDLAAQAGTEESGQLHREHASGSQQEQHDAQRGVGDAGVFLDGGDVDQPGRQHEADGEEAPGHRDPGPSGRNAG